MHIGVNGLRLTGQRFGVGRYIEYLLKYWDRQLLAHERVTVFVRGEVDRQGLPAEGRISLKRLGPAMVGTAWENLALARAARDVDVLFCPSYTAPLWGATPAVVVTHSVDEAEPGTHSWTHTFTRTRLYRASARRSRAVIVPSTATAEAVERLYRVARSKVSVVPLGVDTEIFRPLENSLTARAIRSQYFGSDCPYVLFVGKMSTRRNIPLLLQAFALLRNRGIVHNLLLFGPNHHNLPLENLVSSLGLEGAVVQTDGRVASHSQLVPVYSGADLFVHPTTYDATSLPVLEAFASGVPVITMRTGGLTETCGDAAILLDRWDAEALATAMGEVLTNPSLRKLMVRAGLERARHCSWHSTAGRTLEIVRTVAHGDLPAGAPA